MPKEIMERRAGDNVYLHKDFHGALSEGLRYLAETFGEAAVTEYLDRFATQFYRPLIERIRETGFPALESHFRNMYESEDGKIEISSNDSELILHVLVCPAVTHMREKGYTVAESFVETERTVNAAIARESGLEYRLISYDTESGKSLHRFRRPKS